MSPLALFVIACLVDGPLQLQPVSAAARTGSGDSERVQVLALANAGQNSQPKTESTKVTV